MSGTAFTPEGVTNPPIDELLDRTKSKYALVIIAAKRARQINAYYSQLGEGLLEYVGPLVETAPQEKALSIALREINADLIEFKPHRGLTSHGPGRARRRPAGSPPTRRSSCCARSPRPATTSPSCRPQSALKFVGAPTWAALSHHPVDDDVWSHPEDVPHVRLGREADLVVVAPATADLLARAAHGLADDLLTNTLLTARCPVLFAPAMHTEMWEHPATVDNVATLRRRGVDRARARDRPADRRRHRQGPAARAGRDRRSWPSCCSPRGAGCRPTWSGVRVLISAGGTREPLDPVRFLGNASSGRQGYALATVAAARGAPRHRWSRPTSNCPIRPAPR